MEGKGKQGSKSERARKEEGTEEGKGGREGDKERSGFEWFKWKIGFQAVKVAGQEEATPCKLITMWKGLVCPLLFLPPPQKKKKKS